MRRPRSRRSSGAWRSISRSRSPAREPMARRSRRPGDGAARSAPSATSGARWTCSASSARCCAAAQPGMLVSRSFGPTEGARRDLEQGAAWFADPAASGGLLFELASHDIDLQSALAGPVESVQATAESGLLALAGRPPSPLDDAVAVQMHFAGGGIGTAHVAWSTEQRPPLYALDVQAADSALQLVLDPVFELRGHAAGKPSPSRAACVPASPRSPASWTPCAAAIPPACPAARWTRSARSRPCSHANARSRAASASSSELEASRESAAGRRWRRSRRSRTCRWSARSRDRRPSWR